MLKVYYNGEWKNVPAFKVNVFRNELWYGVEFDTNISSYKCTRIGNLDMHKMCPIQSQMRGCLLDDLGNVVKYLNDDDWTNETRDGSMGMVMVEVPEFWIRFETEGTVRRVKITTVNTEGFQRVPKQYISAYQATEQRSTSTLASVVNLTADYRGGGGTWTGQDEWDDTSKSMLGKARTALSLTELRQYAQRRGLDWTTMNYRAQKTLYWLFVVEYATLNCQDTFNDTPTVEGYRQGGLGDGGTNLSYEKWDAFNGLYPVIPCGYSDSLGNRSGYVTYTMPTEFDTENTVKTQVNRYRGVEIPFGHLFIWVDGVLVQISSSVENGGNDTSKVYVCDNHRKFASTITTDYYYVGNESRESGYGKAHIFGDRGEIVPSTVGGSSNTYLCDGHDTDIPTSGSETRALAFGGNAFNGGLAGFACAASPFSPSDAHATCGSRLCFCGDITT